MRSIALPDTELLSSRLGFGLSGLHHLLRSKERQNLLCCGWENGITYFDTSPSYGHGLAERELGLFARGRRHQMLIATKFGIQPNPWLARSQALMYARLTADAALRRIVRRRRCFAPRRHDYSCAGAVASVDRSLRALRTDHVDILYLHDPTLFGLTDPEKLFGTLRDLKAAGKIRHFGIAGNVSDSRDILSQYPEPGCLLQVNAAPGNTELDILNRASIRFQSSYGHFRSRQEPVADLLAAAVGANREGVILFSTRRPARIESMVQLLSLLETA